MDKDSIAGAQPRHVLERMPRSHEDNWDSGRLFEREIDRDAPHVPGAGEGVSGKPERRDTEYPVARRDVRYSGAGGDYDAGDFVTESPGIRRIAGVEGKRLKRIAKIHSRRFHVDKDLAWSARWYLEWCKAE